MSFCTHSSFVDNITISFNVPIGTDVTVVAADHFAPDLDDRPAVLDVAPPAAAPVVLPAYDYHSARIVVARVVVDHAVVDHAVGVDHVVVVVVVVV
eukprot:CAMPEP_0195308916 /NCGR_PEP_ID=MMETSP0707-20130614/38472_1 /TAXON_ID=33640 /ORGANISM="Asterionellopsis glacialis, Strain CCMP134" /LENGTH=95 /DNA_ID=CAMNT_0040373207 /DNA_START=1371 /DNA_END=1654 /DNA_ORIENTATION=+